MSEIYIDASAGLSGETLLGALVQAAGWDDARLQREWARNPWSQWMRLTLSAHCAEGVHGWAICAQKTSPRHEIPQGHAALCRMPRAILRLDSFLNNVPELAPQHLENFIANQMNAYGGNLDMAAADIRSYTQQSRAVAVVCGSELRCRNMCDALTDAGVPAQVSDLLPRAGHVTVLEGTLSAGFEYPDLGLVVITEGQVLARRKKTAPRRSNRDRVKSYTDLTPGDLVVHEHHGIGRFVGIERMTVDGAERDFVKIAFAGTDFLYVPATSLDLISKYIGGGEPEHVRLNKLGGADWSRSKQRAKAAAKELAEGLIKLYAERAKIKGFAFPQDDAWQREFEDAFPYEETEDQLRCIAEIKTDMESDRPMDRLLCGDVGFGKTEVALRAVMKCVLAGKQAAILVPTTVLARQHYLTALQRFQGYPVTIELLTRYKTGSEQTKLLQKLEAGSVDIVIGTHKLFNKKIKFKDLGLLVVDEEQRFGVSQRCPPRPSRARSIWRSPASGTCPRSRSPRSTAIRCRPSSSSRTTACCSTPCGASSRAAGRCITCTTASRPSTAAPPSCKSACLTRASASCTAKWRCARSTA